MLLSELVRLLNRDSRPGRMLRFGVVGASGAVVNLGVLVFCSEIIKITPLIGVAVAIELSVLSNFFLNNSFTFRAGRTSLFHKMIRYNFIALGGALLNYTVFALCFKGFKLHYIVSDLLAIIAAVWWNYLMSVKFVWRQIDKP